MEYQPHAQTAIEFREECTDEESKIGLLFGLGEACNILGKYKEAEQMHREQLELCKKVLGREHPSALGSMNNLALVLCTCKANIVGTLLIPGESPPARNERAHDDLSRQQR